MSAGRKSLADILMCKGLTRGKAEEAVAAIIESLHESFADGRPASIRGFGSFHFRESRRIRMWDPRMGNRRTVAGRRLLRFRSSEAFLAQVNRES